MSLDPQQSRSSQFPTSRNNNMADEGFGEIGSRLENYTNGNSTHVFPTV